MRQSRLAVSLLSFFLLGIAPFAAAKDKKGAPAPAPPKVATAVAVDPKTFVIGAEDILLVRVWRDPEVSGSVMVRPDGKITLQLLGEIQAAGETPQALTQVIYEGLSKLKQLEKSEVTVTVQQVNSRKYFVQGEVNRGGAFPLLVPTTVLDAVGLAGGFREFANTKKIVIIHRDGTQSHFNYKETIHGKKTEQNIQLMPGDQIYVP